MPLAFVRRGCRLPANLREPLYWPAPSTARRALPAYSHVCSPKKFTQHQLFACLTLKNFLKTDYRGVVAHLIDHPTVVEALELKRIPHFTTLQKAARRLLAAKPARCLLDATVPATNGTTSARSLVGNRFDWPAMRNSDAYFVRRRKKVGSPWKTVVYHRYPKLGVVCDTSNHFILAFHADATATGCGRVSPTVADALCGCGFLDAADAGYDSEPNHEFGAR